MGAVLKTIGKEWCQRQELNRSDQSARGE